MVGFGPDVLSLRRIVCSKPLDHFEKLFPVVLSVALETSCESLQLIFEVLYDRCPFLEKNGLFVPKLFQAKLSVLLVPMIVLLVLYLNKSLVYFSIKVRLLLIQSNFKVL